MTDYSYHLRLNGTSDATLTSNSIFGTVYGLETFIQLLVPGTQGGLVVAQGNVEVHDAPANVWRGLMMDSGRRFFTVSLAENIIDTMAAVKMNVLHLHAADYCRWSIESKIYPSLTATDVTGTSPGFWTQAEASSPVFPVESVLRFDKPLLCVPLANIPSSCALLVVIQSPRHAFR